MPLASGASLHHQADPRRNTKSKHWLVNKAVQSFIARVHMHFSCLPAGEVHIAVHSQDKEKTMMKTAKSSNFL